MTSWKITSPTILCAMAATLLLGSATPAQDADSPDIDERAIETLRGMGRAIADAKHVRFEANAIEQVIDDDTGRTLHFMTRRSVAMTRPDRLLVDEDDSYSHSRFWFVAGELTALDTKSNQYAVVEVPATVDGLLDHLFEKHGLVMPLADLLYSDPFDGLAARLESGVYVGVSTVGGHACHHLAFRQEDLDWQIWIDTRDEQPIPHKLVITYKNEPGQPQFAARFSKWSLGKPIPAALFEPDVPADAERVSVDELTGVEPGSMKQGDRP